MPFQEKTVLTGAELIETKVEAGGNKFVEVADIVTLAGSSLATDLTISNRTSSTLDITSSTGTDATVPFATTSLAGLLEDTDKQKLDWITITQARDLDAVVTEAISLRSLVGVAGSDLDSFTGGIITSDTTIKTALQELETSIVGLASGLQYRGTLLGTADLTADSTGNTYLDGDSSVSVGDFFKISSSGSLTVSDGTIPVNTGDSIYFNTSSADASIIISIIDVIDNTESVTEVFGRTGAVSATAGDYTATQITNTPNGNIAAITVQAALDELDSEKASITTLATTAGAGTIGVLDSGAYYGGSNVEAVLQEIGPNIHGAVTLGAGNSSALTLSNQQLTLNEATLVTNLDIDHLRTVIGAAASNSNDLGTFTGTIITDNQNVKQSIQALETNLDTANSNISINSTDISTLETLSGAGGLAHLGTFTGSTITDGSATIKSALQELETALESLSGSTNLGYTASPTDGTVTSDTGTNATLTLVTGINAGLLSPADFTKLSNITTTEAVNIDVINDAGTFTGTTITDNVSIVTALQELEVAVEGASSDHGTLTGLSDDDHSIYALLAGRSGGQTLIGGTGASNNLILRSTSDGTKGAVRIEGLQFTDEDDPTKIIDLVTSAISTSTTRNWTIPDRDLNFSSGGTFAENSHTHTVADIDNISLGSAGNVPYMDIAATDLTYSPGLIFTGTELQVEFDITVGRDVVFEDYGAGTRTDIYLQYVLGAASGGLIKEIETNLMDFKVATIEAALNHDNLTGFAANEHFTQAAISITESQISDLGSYSVTGHTHTLSTGATDITATAAEVNLLDLSGLTAGWVLSADTATTASWKAPAGGGDSIYTADDTVGSGRVATLTDSIEFTGGNFGIGTSPSSRRGLDVYFEPVNEPNGTGIYSYVLSEITETEGSIHRALGGKIYVPNTVSDNYSNVIGNDIDVDYRSTGATTTVRGIDSYTLAAFSGTIQNLDGVFSQVVTSSTGTISNARVFTGEIVNTSSTITDLYGSNMRLVSNSGTITNTYGHYVGDITTGTQTNTPWSFYASDSSANNYFSGQMQLPDYGGAGYTGTKTKNLAVDTDGWIIQEDPPAEVNDLTAAVTWTNVPDANITQSSVTQHEAALSITESQISDLTHIDSLYTDSGTVPTSVTATVTDQLNFTGGVVRFDNDTMTFGNSTSEEHGLKVYQPFSSYDAFMTFHVAGDYAVHFGLDGTTNDLFVGGWSMGAVKHKIWHAGNDGAGSGLDADLLDGANLSSTASTSTVVQRTAGGYIYANYFNTTANDVSSGVTKVMVETGNDNFIRHGSAAAIRTFINVEDGATAGGLDGWHGSTTRIKILPADFINSTNNTYPPFSATGGEVDHVTSSIVGVVSVVIPEGFKATHVNLYSGSSMNIEVYENWIDNATATSKGTASSCTSCSVDITDVTASTTNYLSIKVTHISDNIYGGYVTIAEV